MPVDEKRLVCPSCKWDGSTDGQWDGWFRYVVENEHRVEGFNRRGILQVAEEDPVVVDGPEDRRIRCGNCLAVFPLPKETKIEMV